MQKNKVFLLNPDHADILNGERRAPSNSKKMGWRVKMVLIVGGLADLALTIFGVVWMVTTLADWAALNERGVTVEGRLIGRDTSIIHSQGSGPRSSSLIYYWLYTYTVGDGQRLEGRVQVKEEAYEDYIHNTPVQVLYLEGTPDVSRLADENAFEFQRFPVFGGGVNGLMVFILVIIGWREFQKNRRYQREGRVIDGWVVAPILNEGESQGKRVATLSLNYRITSPVTGKEIHRIKQHRRDDLTEADLPLEGSPLAVLYVNDQLFTVL